MDLSKLIADLRRRRVFRALAWYSGAAILVIQTASATFTPIGLSDSALRYLIILCLIGYPIVAVLSWLFDLLPAGPTAPDEESSPSSRPQTWRSASLWLAMIGGIALGIGSLAVWRNISQTTQPVIAVLPFESPGTNSVEADFLTGLHDTLITHIARVRAIRVLPRATVLALPNSSQGYEKALIELGASHALVGSAMRAGQQLRVQVQLVDLAQRSIVWADAMDRPATDLFNIQRDIALAITRGLNLSLSQEELAMLTALPTPDPTAYEHYILGRAAFLRDVSSAARRDFDVATREFESALARDPSFALAHAQLATLLTVRSWWEISRRQELLASAQQHIERAFESNPQLPEAVLARGFHRYLGSHDFPGAQVDLERARSLLPLDYQAHHFLGLLYRRQGRWQEARESFERAIAIEPRSIGSVVEIVPVLLILRDKDSLLKVLDLAIKHSPEDAALRTAYSTTVFGFDGDGAAHVARLDALANSASANYEFVLAYYTANMNLENFDRAIEIMDLAGDYLATSFPGVRDMMLGLALDRAGRAEDARAVFVRADAAFAKINFNQLAEKRAVLMRTFRAFVQLGLGERTAALAAARNGVTYAVKEDDVYDRSFQLLYAAQVLALAGEDREALDAYNRLLVSGTSETPVMLWSNWTSSSLRNTPEFQALLVAHGYESHAATQATKLD